MESKRLWTTLERSLRGLLAPGLLALGAAAHAAPTVVASIKPVHSLVASVMVGVGTPELLLPGAGSPHTYAMRPSQARVLERADLVVWVGESLEVFLRKPLAGAKGAMRVLTLSEVEGMHLLPARTAGVWETNDRASHGSDAHGENGQTEHAAGGINPHLWLTPVNARVVVTAVAHRLGRLDPGNAQRYDDNAADTLRRIEALDAALSRKLRAVRDIPYVVFHDAYPYFEQRYDLRAMGAITVSAGRAPGAKRLTELRRKITDWGARCVFSEPQFEPKIVSTVLEDTPARAGVLDPLGADIEPGPEAWFTLMERLAGRLIACLSS